MRYNFKQYEMIIITSNYNVQMIIINSLFTKFKILAKKFI